MEKQVLDALLKRIETGAVGITYWDGTHKVYGKGKPYLTLTLSSPKVARRILKNHSLGLGESYMDGSLQIDGPIDQIMRLAEENRKVFDRFSLKAFTSRTHKNSKPLQRKYIQHHYDLGNDFYKLWLDSDTMLYTCAYYRTPQDTLEQAQKQKIDHVLRKLQLQKGQSLLDMGCGWGYLLIRAAEKYGVTGLGVTLSSEQHAYATAEAKKRGLDKQISFELANYQDLLERKRTFDRVVSVGLLEHVGRGNHQTYFDVVNHTLKDGGVSVLHSITGQWRVQTDPWIDKYIFPGGYLPAIDEVVGYLPANNFRLLDYENLRMHYVRTLDEWLRRFERHAAEITTMYDERFVRMWRFWLACSSGSFRYGQCDLSQFVFTKGLNNDLPLTREHLYKA